MLIRVEPPFARREWWILGVLSALGLALRVSFVFHMEAHPGHVDPILDSEFHVSWARAIAAGREYAPLAGQPFFRAPLYVWFLGGLFAVFGDGLLLPRLIQCLLGTASIVLVYLVGRRAFGPRSAAPAAAIAATYWLLIYYDGELMGETLGVFLSLLALWTTLGLAAAPGRARALGAGLLWGATALVRPNVLLFMPLVPPWILFLQRPRALRGLAAAVLFGVGVLAPILPVTAYNTLVRGDFALIGSYGGINLWIGNNPHANGIDAFVPGSRSGWWEGYFDAITLAERAEGRTLRASEVSRHYSRLAWDFILSQPERSIPLFGRKFLLFWAGEYGNNEPELFVANHHSWVPRLSLGYAVLAPLALIGMAFARRDVPRVFPLYGYFLTYLGSLVLFFVASRYRIPVLPVMMVFAGHGLASLWLRLRSGARWQPAAAGAFVVAFALWAEAYGPAPEMRMANGNMLLAKFAEDRGETERAAELLHRVLELQPDRPDAWVALARVERMRGNVDEAIAHYVRAVNAHPLDLYAFEGLLELAVAEGRLEQAERWILRYLRTLREAGVRDAPETPYYYLALIRAERGDANGARAALAGALERDPHSARAALALGDLERRRARWPEAADAYARALFALRPHVPGADDDRAFAGLVDALEAAGRHEDACRRAAQWRERRPGSEPAAEREAGLCPGDGAAAP